jgi:hypothetical protein
VKRHDIPRLAERAARVANLLRGDAFADALDHARVHAEAHGYPSNTLGDGGSRSTEPTSSTERAALTYDPTLEHYARMLRALRRLDSAAGELTDLAAHWSPGARDELPKASVTRYCCNPRCPLGDIPLQRYYGGRHRKCYDFWRHNGRDLSVDDLKETELVEWLRSAGADTL